MTSAWSDKNHLGLADIPLIAHVSVSFQLSVKGVSYLRNADILFRSLVPFLFLKFLLIHNLLRYR